MNHLTPVPDEPRRGDPIQLLDDEDMPCDEYSQVQRVTSYDPGGELFEVIDSRGQLLIVSFLRADDTKMIWLLQEVIG